MKKFWMGYFIGIVAFGVMVGFLLPTNQSTSAQGRTPLACGQNVVISTASAATVSLVAETTNQRTAVCSFLLNGAGATTAKFVYGTGATCGTGTTDATGAMKLIDGSSIPHGSGSGVVFRIPVGQRLCLVNSAAIQVSGVLAYEKER